MDNKGHSIQKMQNGFDSKRILKICRVYFFSIAVLYLLFAISGIGMWSLKSSSTYFVIIENIFIGYAIFKYWRTVLRVILVMQILLLVRIIIGDLGLKVINSMYLIVLIFANIALTKYRIIKGT